MLAVTVWYMVSAKRTFKGPVRTIDDVPDGGVGMPPAAPAVA
jgi:hypothetical protein